MKRLLQLGLFLSLAIAARAQSTTVTATITDSDGQTWNNGTVTASFLPGPVQSYVWPGGPIPPMVKANLNGSGSFTMSLPDNSTINPTGSLWNFSICPNASAPCVTKQIAVSGPSLDLSTQLSSVAAGPRFSAGSSSYGYLDVEVSPLPLPGGVYWNVTNIVQRIWTGTQWVNQGGGGPGTCPGCVLLNPSATPQVITFNANGGNLLALSNNSSGASAISGLFLINDVGDAFLGLDSSGGGTPSGVGLQNLISGGPLDLQTVSGNIVLRNYSTHTSMILSGGVSTNNIDIYGSFNYAPDTGGSANTYVVNLPQYQYSNLWPGEYVNFTAAHVSNGASTLNVDAAGAVAFTKQGGTALGAGDILVGAMYTAVYDGVEWQLLNSSLGGGGGGSCGEGVCVQNAPTATQVVAQPIVSTVQTTLAINSLENFDFASQFQTGGGNNGIANVAAANTGTGITGVADPGYASTEVIPGLTGGAYGGNLRDAIPSWPTFTHMEDNRVGKQADVYTESGTAQYTTVPAHEQYSINTYDVTGQTLLFTGFLNQANFEGTGHNIAGFGAPLKSYWVGDVLNSVSSVEGQKLLLNLNQFCTGIGDCIDVTRTLNCNGGYSASSDEGCHDHDLAVEEENNVYQGTVTGSPSTGATTITTAPTRDSGTQGDGMFLLDTASGDVISGNPPSEYTTGNFGFPASPTIWGPNGQVPTDAVFVGTSFTPSINLMICSTINGGTCPDSPSSNPTGSINVATNTYSPGTVTVQVITVAPGLPNDYATSTSGLPGGAIPVCIADGSNYEMALATVTDSTHLSVQFNKPHNNGATLSYGGYCGYGLEVTGATTTEAGRQFRQVFPVVGTLDGTDLLIWDHNSQQNWSHAMLENNNAVCFTDNIAITNVTGTTVTFVDTTASGGSQPYLLNSSGALVTTANSTYNGTFTMTGTYGTYGGNFPWPMYQYTASISGTQPGTGTVNVCNSGFKLYPMAETLQVLNPSTNKVDGYFGVGVNTVPWTSGDTVEQAHYFAMQVQGGGESVYQNLPAPPLNGIPLDGMTVGNNFDAGIVYQIHNVTPNSSYAPYGGTLKTSGTGFNLTGLFQTPFDMQYPPLAVMPTSTAVIQIDNCKPSPIGCGDQSRGQFDLFNLTASANTDIVVDPAHSLFATGGAFGIDDNGLTPEAFLYARVTGEIDFAGPQSINNYAPTANLSAHSLAPVPSGYSPPTNYTFDQFTSFADQVVDFGTSNTSTGLFYGRGRFDMGSLGFYVAGATGATLNSTLGTDTTPGDVICGDATPGDTNCTFKAGKVVTTGSSPTVTLGTGGPSWTTGVVDPTGSCVTGSLYSNSAGASGHVFWTCVATAWVDVK